MNQTCTHPTGYQRPQFDLRFLLTLTTIAAIWSALFPIMQWGSVAVLTVIGLTYLFGCWRTKRSVLVLLPCVYIAYAWLVVPWPTTQDSYQLQWIGMWFQLPGLLAEIPFHPQPDLWFHTITASVTVIYFLAVVTLGRVNKTWLAATATIVSYLSFLSSLLCYQLYCMHP